MSRAHKAWWIAFAAVTALVVGLGALYLDRAGRERTARYLELAETYTAAFADRAALYLSRGNPDALDLLANTASTLLFGDVVLYVQAVHAGERVVDARSALGEALPLPLLDAPPALQSERRRAPDGPPYVDVVKRLFPLRTDSGEPLDGYVRIGTSLAQLEAELAGERWTVAALGAGVWAVLLLGVWLGARWLHPPVPASAVSAPAATMPEPEAEPAPPPEPQPAPVPAARRIGTLTIDDTRKAVTVRGEPVELSPKEFELLSLLGSHPGKVFANDEILAAVWAEQDFASAQDVKQYIYFLRRKLEADPKKPALIVTVRGFGYKLAGGKEPAS